MKKYDAIVVGAGVGGLAAACKLAKEGLKTLLLEKHNIPGGSLTTFRRGRFEFEAGVHYIAHYGTKEKPQTIYKILDEFGIADRFEAVPMRNNVVIKRPGCEEIYLPARYEETVAYLKNRYPDEVDGIDKYFDIIYGVMKDYKALFNYDFDHPNPLENMDPEATPEKYPYYYKYAYMPTMQFMGEVGIRNQELFILLTILGNFAGPAAFNTVIDVADWMCYNLECPPVKMPHGFQQVSSVMAEQVENFGGEVLYNQEVSEFIVEEGKIAGVRTIDGNEYGAPIVMYNGSPLRVFRSMIKPEAVPAGIINEITSEMKGYDDFDRVGAMTYFGLDCTPEELGIKDEVVFCFGKRGMYQVECAETMGGDFHKPDKSVISFFTYASYKDWISVPPEEYHRKKMEVEAAALSEAESMFPGFSSHVEEADVMTPITLSRYLGHPCGSMAGFRIYNREYLLNPMQLDNRIPGLYFVGAWANNIGCVHPSFANGYGVAKAVVESLAK